MTRDKRRFRDATHSRKRRLAADAKKRRQEREQREAIARVDASPETARRAREAEHAAEYFDAFEAEYFDAFEEYCDGHKPREHE